MNGAEIFIFKEISQESVFLPRNKEIKFDNLAWRGFRLMRLMVFPNRCTTRKGDSYVMLTAAQQPGWPTARFFREQFPPSTCSPGQHGRDSPIRGVRGKLGLCGRCWRDEWKVWLQDGGL